MKKHQMGFVSLTVVFLLVMVVGVSRAQRPTTMYLQDEAQPQSAAGSAFTYQGALKKGGNPVNATCDMVFNLYGQAVGGTLVAGPLTLSVPVANSLFTVKLDFGAGVFNGDARWLGIQVQCPGDAGFADLGRQELTPVPYALQAVGSPYQNVVVVAKKGGDYTNVQSAVDSITDAAADNPYLVWIAPGVYNGAVVMKPYVHLQGAGQDTTILASKNGSEVWPPTTGGLILAANTSLRDLTLKNTGTYSNNVTLLAPDETTGVLVSDVTIQVQGVAAHYNAAMYQNGANSSLTLINVTALAENATSANYAVYKYQALSMTLRGGSFTARGGYEAQALYQSGANTWLEAWDITALGENGTYNHGLCNVFDAAVTLHGGSFTGQGGTYARGIFNYQAEFTAEGVTALGENGSEYTYGFYNGQYATATLSGGTFTARGGGETFGIYNTSSDLTTEGVMALGEDGVTENRGLHNSSTATAVLNGGSFTGRGGTYARGIYNLAGLEFFNSSALGEDGTNTNYGLYNVSTGSARLRGGSFTARGGLNTKGIYINDYTSMLNATDIDVIAVGGSATNYGLEEGPYAYADITESFLDGTSYSIYVDPVGDQVNLSNSKIGHATSGKVFCTAVTRNTFLASGCP